MRLTASLLAAALLVARDARATSCATYLDTFELELVSRTVDGVETPLDGVHPFRRRLSGLALEAGVSIGAARFDRVTLAAQCPEPLVPDGCRLLWTEVCAYPAINAECIARCGQQYACR